MDTNNIVRVLILLGGGSLILYWQWRTKPPLANRRYFFYICIGFLVIILGFLGITILSQPLSDIAFALLVAGVVIMIVFIRKYERSKRSQE